MAELILIEQFRDYLVAQGVVTPQDAPTPSAPTVWLQPRDGFPEPRRDKTTNALLESATVTLNDSQLGGVNDLSAWIEETFVDVIVVAPGSPAGKLLHRTIRNLIHPIGSHGGRKQWMMGALLVEQSTVWRSEQPLYQDAQTYSRTASYRFLCRRKALAGTPDLP